MLSKKLRELVALSLFLILSSTLFSQRTFSGFHNYYPPENGYSATIHYEYEIVPSGSKELAFNIWFDLDPNGSMTYAYWYKGKQYVPETDLGRHCIRMSSSELDEVKLIEANVEFLIGTERHTIHYPFIGRKGSPNGRQMTYILDKFQLDEGEKETMVERFSTHNVRVSDFKVNTRNYDIETRIEKHLKDEENETRANEIKWMDEGTIEQLEIKIDAYQALARDDNYNSYEEEIQTLVSKKDRLETIEKNDQWADEIAKMPEETAGEISRKIEEYELLDEADELHSFTNEIDKLESKLKAISPESTDFSNGSETLSIQGTRDSSSNSTSPSNRSTSSDTPSSSGSNSNNQTNSSDSNSEMSDYELQQARQRRLEYEEAQRQKAIDDAAYALASMASMLGDAATGSRVYASFTRGVHFLDNSSPRDTNKDIERGFYELNLAIGTRVYWGPIYWGMEYSLGRHRFAGWVCDTEETFDIESGSSQNMNLQRWSAYTERGSKDKFHVDNSIRDEITLRRFRYDERHVLNHFGIKSGLGASIPVSDEFIIDIEANLGFRGNIHWLNPSINESIMVYVLPEYRLFLNLGRMGFGLGLANYQYWNEIDPEGKEAYLLENDRRLILNEFGYDRFEFNTEEGEPERRFRYSKMWSFTFLWTIGSENL